MTTRTTALATQQQATPEGLVSTVWRAAAPRSAAASSPFLADGCRKLAFMPPASPGTDQRRQRRTAPSQGSKVPALQAPPHAQPRWACGGMVAVGGSAVDHDGDHRVHRQPPEHERQSLHRLAVSPLHVVDQDGHRRPSLQLPQHFQQPRAHRERGARRVGPAPRTGHPGGTSGRPEQLVHDPEVQIGLNLVGTSRQHPRARSPGQATPGQSRLSHSRIALNGHQPRLPRLYPGDDLRYPRDLRLPADKQIERRLPNWHTPTSLLPAIPASSDTWSVTTGLGSFHWRLRGWMPRRLRSNSRLGG